MDDFDAYIGLDVHKDTVAVALAAQGRGRPEYLCELRNGGDVPGYGDRHRSPTAGMFALPRKRRLRWSPAARRLIARDRQCRHDRPAWTIVGAPHAEPVPRSFQPG